MNDLTTDTANRLLALDPSQSFIVQAPAGSGKTSLLTQRFLRLLVSVEKPESILAITFTKKAAAEMHQRIIDALKMAQKPKPSEPYLQQMWLLAVNVLQVSADNNWQLLNNNSRLRVQTIDSLCASLTKQMPVLSQFGAQPSVEADCRPLYDVAARAVLSDIEQDDLAGDAVRLLVAHLDNQLNRAQDLIADMLAKRDQWLRHVLSGGSVDRAALESTLQSSVENGLAVLSESFSDSEKEEILQLLDFAASHAEFGSDLASFGKGFDFDQLDYESHSQWQMLVGFLLSSSDTFRKSATAKMGFPAQTAGVDKAEKTHFSGMKKRYKELLLALPESPHTLAALVAVKSLPKPFYSDQQWAFIEALMTVLPLAVAHLRLVFQQTGRVDFCEVSLSASRALHDESGVTEQGLKMDYQLQHILVDEFQDTSETQYELLKDLVSGWQADDGRSLFLVGDPMQSIYRFRQAEVGLFLKTQQQGLGEVNDIKALHISANFRSQAAIVGWVNEAFSQIMPANDDIYSSAISYKPSIAALPEVDLESLSAVNYYPHTSREQEGNKLCQLIQSLQTRFPDDTVAVLVRGRTALKDLVGELNQAQIPFQASDIDPLATREVVLDLLSLTRACLQLADKVAWLAILRAPWCGLSLADLLALSQGAGEVNIYDVLNDESHLLTLSEDGQQRARLLATQMRYGLSLREQMPLVDVVKGIWQGLLGPSCLTTSLQLQDAQRYFTCLAELEANSNSVDLKTLQQRVEKLYSAVDSNASDKLQIMTVHKSKGLEFDHVILPGLDRASGRDKQPLLEWLERPSEFEENSELLIAPIKETGSQAAEPISQYLAFIAKQKSQHESQRLLYVAATRAKKALHLSFTVKPNTDETAPKEPAKSTLLGLLWPSIKNNFSVDLSSEKIDKEVSVTNCKIKRIKYINPLDYKVFQADSLGVSQTKNIPDELDWDALLATSIGTVCHRLMELAGLNAVVDETGFNQNFSQQMIGNLLREAGVLEAKLTAGLAKVAQILTSCLQDKRGLWVLDHQHQDSAFEYALSGVLNGEIKHFRLDRTFICDGQRWIIDYKTSTPKDQELESFLNQQQASYKEQLEQYAQLFLALDNRPIKLAIYHPACAGWREWDYRA